MGGCVLPIVSDASAGILEVKKSLRKPMLLCTWQRATDTVTMGKQDINKALRNVEALLKEDQSASPQIRPPRRIRIVPAARRTKPKASSGRRAVRMDMRAPTSRKKNIPIGSKL